MTQVAVLGLGYFSQLHIAAWRKLYGATLCAGFDINPDRRAWAKHSFDFYVADTLDDAISTDAEIIDIVAPPAAHAELLHAAIKPGRVLICQKPFCTSLAEAKSIVDMAAQMGCRVIVHENFRFQPWYRTIKARLDQGALGQIYQARFAFRPGDGRGPKAYLDRQPTFQTMPRLLLHETGVHFVDLFRWLFGDIMAVYAEIRQVNPVLAGEDAGFMVFDHASRTRSTFDGNRLSDHPADDLRRTMGEMQIETEAGTLMLDGFGTVSFRDFRAPTAQMIPLVDPVDDTFGGGCVEALCRHVLKAVHGAGEFENEAHQYLPVIHAVDMAYQSAQLGQKIYIENAGV